jgi:putative ABC transport system permease protein
MSTGDMELLTGISGDIDLVELSVLANSEELSGYADKINTGVPAISARLVKRVTASETTVLSKLQGLILLVTIVVLALTMICVATTMTAVVAERRREIGLRKAIGASDGSIVKEFMGEGIFLGGVGGILGSVLGFVFAETVTINVFSGSISFRPALVPITIIASVAVTVLASISPIKSATSIEPALVLKGE